MINFFAFYLPMIISWVLTLYNLKQLLVLRKCRELASAKLHKNDMLWQIGHKFIVSGLPLTEHEAEQFAALLEEMETKNPL